MDGDEGLLLGLPDLFRGSDTCNGEDLVVAGSGIRASADVFEENMYRRVLTMYKELL